MATTPVASSYVRVKLLLAPAAAPASSSASVSSSPACVSYAVRKLEVPRSLSLSKLHSKLAALYGGGGGGGAGACVKLELALDASCMDDGAVDASSKVSGLLWEELVAQNDSSPGAAPSNWSQGRDKVLIRLTPQPAVVASASSSSSASAAPVAFTRVVLQPMVPAKSPAPWPRFSPAPGSLPLIILNNEERDWEVLDDDDFDQIETDAAQAPCKQTMASSSANSAADIAAKNPRAPVAEVLAASASAKPHRVIAPELLAKLSGGSSSSSSSSALGAAVPPAPFSGSITFSVNKTVYTVANPGPMDKVADYLRYKLGITGPKIGCGEGGCGACIVLLSRQDPTTGQLVSFSTNACLHPLAGLDGWAVTTTEGLVTEQDGVAALHPIQTAVVNNWATQCGYCTPGFVMSMYGLLQETATPTAQQVEDRFDGNLCRCTGYRPIFKAMRAVVPGLAEQEIQKQKALAQEVMAATSAGKCGCASSSGKKGGCGSSSSSSSSSASASSSSCASTASSCGSGGAKLTPCGKGEGLSCSSGAKAACASVGVGCGFADKHTTHTHTHKHSAKVGLSNANACTDVEDLVLYDPKNPRHNLNAIPSALVEHSRSKVTRAASAVQWSADETTLWIVPKNLADVFAILNYYVPLGEVVKLIGGNTSIGVEKYYPVNAKSDNPTVLVPLSDLTELKSISLSATGLSVGACVTLAQLIVSLEGGISSLPASSTSSWVAVVRHLKVVANTGIRNVATWAGNMMLCKTHPQFPSDLVTVFSAIGATVVLTSASSGSRGIPVSALGNTTLAVDEIIQTLYIPLTPPNYAFDSYKVRSRHQNAHAIINAAYSLTYVAGAKGPSGFPVIGQAQLFLGGLSQAGVFAATKTCGVLQGAEMTPATMSKALAVLDAEAVAVGRLDPSSTYFISDAGYRHSLALATFFKFFSGALSAAGVAIPSRDQSAFEHFVRPVSSGSEVFTPDASEAPVGQAVPKVESSIQASGAARYIDDESLPANGLWGAYVYSTVGEADLVSMDATVAMGMPGVVRFVTAADIATAGCSNNCGSFPGDEEIFASTKVTATGQALGMILADTRLHAEAAAKVVEVTYANVNPKPLVTIDDAIAANSFFPDNAFLQNPPPITRGDFASAYAASPFQLTGTSHTGGQAHFSMETQTCLVSPRDNNAGLDVQSSSQGPTDIRAMVMRVANLPANRVTVTTNRTGGAFGGKLSRSHPIVSAATVAAKLTGRPIKSQCSRETDMDMWGKRSHMQMTWQVGFDANGKILALNVVFYQLGGHTYEGNFGSMSMCLLWADNAYYIPAFSVSGKTCRTNTPSNTAMRGPGAMKSIWHAELIMDRIASALKMSPDAVRLTNFYTEGQTTPYGMPITGSTMLQVWNGVQAQADYNAQKASVAAFNAANKWRKRGVHCTAVKYGIGVPGNQVGLLMNVCQDDGTLVVSVTGCELGQGLNTKVAQTVAQQLGVDMSLVFMGDNATNIVANGSQTGGSATSESACAAAIIACTDLKARLAPFVKANPTAAWPAIIAAAATAMVNLTVSAQYFVAPQSAFPFTYFVNCCSCSLIELDVLTGEVEVLQTDIVYDGGNSLNPAVDIGQIEGAFIQGLGHYLTEDIIADQASARLTTRGTWDYHPPCSQDIPLSFNVTLLAASPNNAPQSVLGSKASAEPPMMLSCSLFFAVRDAIAAVRADQGLQGWFDLPTPASTQSVQLACGINAASLVL